jgi:hypothetical protein
MQQCSNAAQMSKFEPDACRTTLTALTAITSVTVSCAPTMRASTLLFVLALSCSAVVAIAAADAAVAVPFDDCGSKVMAILNVTVRPPCSGSKKKNHTNPHSGSIDSTLHMPVKYPPT